MDVRKLEYFVEVAKNKSFTAAAGSLRVSQPMLSKVIRQMEEALGFRLIDRGSRRFELTAEGAQFYAGAVRLLDEHAGLMNLFADRQRLMTGEVVLAVPAVILSLYFPKFLMEFRRKYPGIRINIYEEGSKGCLQSVLEEQAHIGVVMLPVHAGGLEITHLTADRTVLLASRRHALAARRSVHLGELRKENFIIFNRRFVLHDMILRACDSEGFTPNVIYQSSLDAFIVNMVALDQGVTILPRPLARTYRKSELRSIELTPVIPWKIAMILKAGRYRSPAAQGMVDEIKAFFAPTGAAEG